MNKPALIFALAALAVGGWFFSRGRVAAPEAKGSAGEELVATVEKRDIESSIDVSGEVTPAYQLEVKPEVGGKLKILHVVAGQTVKQGDLLVEIDDSDLLTEKASALTEIEGAKLSMERAKKNFERARELFEQKLVSREVFDNLTAEFELGKNGLVKTERKLQIVEDRLQKTKVLCPTDGTVLTVPVVRGQVVIGAASVNNGTTLMTIANLSMLRIELHINQVDKARLSLEKAVQIRAEALKDETLEAHIAFIAPIATTKNNVKGFQVQALIEKADPRLSPGMTVMLNIPIGHAEDAVSVPVGAVFKSAGNKRVVYVKNGDATEKREVKIGVTNIDHAQILNGVKEGEQILLVEPGKLPKRS
ncbi:MAG: efflux RND transporter periplasmic adaptor subunit [Chthoniobacter sp.]|nr:efflux RND transporter periplasmic adaptor subunit [Chthoniobacter sp.]